MNLSALRLYVRDLTGVYATDLVSDSLLDRWINEALFELYRTNKWSWAATTLVTGTDTPNFDAQFHAILAYRTAVKVLATQADDTKRAEAYAAEYTGFLASMVQFYFPKVAAAAVGNRGQLRQQVRDLTGAHTDDVSDAMLNQWLDEAYNSVARQKDWDWLENTQEFAVTGVGPYALTNGSRRVLSAQLIDERGVVEEVFERADTVNVNSNRRAAYYDVTTGGSLTLSPEERFDGGENYTLRVRYTRALTNFVNDASVPLFAAQFYPMLAYLVAFKTLQFLNGDENRGAMCQASAAELFDGMVAFYELSHDDTAFQMGVEGRELQQYPYWFRRV